MATIAHEADAGEMISPAQAMPKIPLETPCVVATTPMAENETRPPLCKHWARSKICLYHAKGKCKFDHPADYEIPPIVQPKRKSRQTDLSHRHRSAGGRLQTRNDARVAILRAFLAGELERNGISDLSSYRVLDVAGGKGELAFQLLNLNNVSSCHVIDPRPLSLGRFQKRLSRGFYHRSQGILQTDVVRPQSEPERPVDQLRCFFSSELWEEEEGTTNNSESEDKKEKNNNNNNNNNDTNNNDTNETIDKNFQRQRERFFANCYKAKGWVWPPAGSDNEHISCGKNFEDRDDIPTKGIESMKLAEEANSSTTDTTSLDTATSLGIDFDNASSIVKTADLVVGMHPDQAVDAIVDAALYQNISFFVVPCCTYSREFPHRRVCVPVSENGRDETTMKLVTTYEELVDYLQAKSPDIQRHVLPFEGRNICLYRVVPPKETQEGKKDN